MGGRLGQGEEEERRPFNSEGGHYCREGLIPFLGALGSRSPVSEGQSYRELPLSFLENKLLI